MTHAPLLEDLRQHAAPVWLWDPARVRVVWANAQGIALFDCETLFDLIDKPFDVLEPGVEAILRTSAELDVGHSHDLSLHFASTGQQETIDCTVHRYPLADNRPGLLVVGKLPVAETVQEKASAKAAPENMAAWQTLLAAIPRGAAICGADGQVLLSNAELQSYFGPGPLTDLTSLVANADRAAALIDKLQGHSVSSSIERVETSNGSREFRLTFSRLLDDAEGRILLLAEDVTERRRLERRLSELADAAPITVATPATTPPMQSTAEQVFAEIGRQLSRSLRSPAKEAESQATSNAPVAMAKSVSDPAPALASMPDAIRQTLEQAATGIAICQQGKPVFVTEKALRALGHDTVANAFADATLWQNLTAIAPGNALQVTTSKGNTVTVSAMPMPWQNGRAMQYTILAPAEAHPKAKTENPVPVAATPAIVSEAPAAPVAPSASVTELRPVANHPSTETLHHELKAILDVVSDGIVTLNAEGDILSFSAGAEAIFGIASGACVGRPLSDLLSSESRRTWRDYIKSLSGPGLGAVFNDGREMTAIHKNGGTLPLFISLSRLQMPQGNARYCAVVRDIAPWKKTERELTEAKEKAEQANRRKSEFIAHVSHELRTPLNAILGFSDVMRSEKLGAIGNNKYLAYANDIHASGNHLLSIVNDLLDLAKVEAGKIELNFTAISLHDLADYVLRMTKDEAAQNGVVVRKALPPDLPRVVGDLKSLRQVLFNLVSNAIKFTDTGGEVLLSAHVESSGALSLRVKDTGIGMTADQLEAALRPFGRVEDATRPRQGTGLGLPLTKSLVEANRANLVLRSEPGRGTVAEVMFPGPRVLAE